MIEEAAGTRLYESKKEAAQKTIEKKDAKLKEIDSVISFIFCLSSVRPKDFLFLAARLVAYWPAPIHAVAPLAYTVLTWLPASLAVC